MISTKQAWWFKLLMANGMRFRKKIMVVIESVTLEFFSEYQHFSYKMQARATTIVAVDKAL